MAGKWSRLTIQSTGVQSTGGHCDKIYHNGQNSGIDGHNGRLVKSYKNSNLTQNARLKPFFDFYEYPTLNVFQNSKFNKSNYVLCCIFSLLSLLVLSIKHMILGH